MKIGLYRILTCEYNYSTDVNFIASQALARGQQKPAEGGSEGGDNRDAMEALEREVRAPAGFVAASTGPQAGNIKPPAAAKTEVPKAVADPDAIDLDAMEE